MTDQTFHDAQTLTDPLSRTEVLQALEVLHEGADPGDDKTMAKLELIDHICASLDQIQTQNARILELVSAGESLLAQFGDAGPMGLLGMLGQGL